MKYILFVNTLFIFFSCDPAHNIDYVIHNNTGQTVQIEAKYFYESDTIRNTISHDYKLVIYNDSELGYSNERYLDQLKSIFIFKYLKIVLKNGKSFVKDPLDIVNWDKIYDSNNYRLVLHLEKDDFK